MFASKFLVFLSLSIQASDNSALNCCLRVVLYVPLASARHKVLYLITTQGQSVYHSFSKGPTMEDGWVVSFAREAKSASCPTWPVFTSTQQHNNDGDDEGLQLFGLCGLFLLLHLVLGSDHTEMYCPKWKWIIARALSPCVRECMRRCRCRCVRSAASVMSPRWAVTINPYLRRKQVSSPEEAIILQPG